VDKKDRPPIKTIADLGQAALKRSGLADTDLEQARMCRWCSMDLTIDEPSPMNARMLVIALFHDESTIRVYEVPVNAAPDDKPLMPRRVSLTKSSVVGNETFVIEDMTLERMADVLADELSVLEGAVTTSEREARLWPGSASRIPAARLSRRYRGRRAHR
jgi:hypothetical protein